MPEFLNGVRRFLTVDQKDTIPVNHFEGITGDGRVVLRDRRGTVKAEVPEVTFKSETLSDDPLAIYKPTGAKHVDASKAMGNFTGWTYASVNAIAMEAVGIQLRLYQIKGKNHEEVDDHDLLDLLEFPNENMIGLELKYTLMAHLELTGNSYWLLDGVTDDKTPPRAIYPLNPGRVRVKLDKSSFPFKIGHYEFTIDDNIYKFQPHQILHIRYPDPGDPYVGIGFQQTIPVKSRAIVTP